MCPSDKPLNCGPTERSKSSCLEDSDVGLSKRKAISSSLFICLRFLLTQANISLVLLRCPYFIPDSQHCRHTSTESKETHNKLVKYELM